MTKHSKKGYVKRRAELLAELFLEELEPDFVAQAEESGFLFDFLIGFPNPEGGVNTFAVELQSTERPPDGSFELEAHVYAKLAHSNIPVLLLLIDVKANVIYFAWPGDHEDLPRRNGSVKVPVTQVDPETRRALIDRMTTGTFA